MWIIRLARLAICAVLDVVPKSEMDRLDCALGAAFERIGTLEGSRCNPKRRKPKARSDEQSETHD